MKENRAHENSYKYRQGGLAKGIPVCMGHVLTHSQNIDALYRPVEGNRARDSSRHRRILIGIDKTE